MHFIYDPPRGLGALGAGIVCGEGVAAHCALGLCTRLRSMERKARCSRARASFVHPQLHGEGGGAMR
jgi:hypothetical protein